MTLTILIIDDDEARHDELRALVAQSAPGARVDHITYWYDFVDHIDRYGAPDLALLDHDLDDLVVQDPVGDRPANGVDVAAYLAKHAPDTRFTLIHSWNEDGARQMANILRERGMHSASEPFGSITFHEILQRLLRQLPG